MSAKNHIRTLVVFVLTTLPVVALAAAPTVSTLTPADNASNVSVTTSTLRAVFSEAVQGSAGNFQLYSANEGLIETIGAKSSKVTGSGTTTLTITFAVQLKSGVAYHVRVDTNAVLNGTGEAYAGIADSTTWNFSTLKSSGASRMEVKRRAYQIGLGQQAQQGTVESTAEPVQQPQGFSVLGSRGGIRTLVNSQPREVSFGRKTESLQRLIDVPSSSSMQPGTGKSDERFDRICGRVLKSFSANPTMLARVNERIQKRFGFMCK